MEHLLGITSFTIVASVVLICAHYARSISHILIAAFVIRTLAAFIHFYVVPLPYSQADALKFEETAWQWAQAPSGFQFLENPTYFISWIIALLYRLTDRSPLMAQSLSVLFGTLTVMIGWLLARELWNDHVAKKAAWGIAFFPTLILFSAIILREAYFWFFLLLALLGTSRWLRTPSIRELLLALTSFVIGILFHGVMALGLFAFLSFVILGSARQFFVGLGRGLFRIKHLVAIIAATGLIALYMTGVVILPKFGKIENIAQRAWLFSRVKYSVEASREEVAYPEWLIPKTGPEALWKAPIRVAYFFFSPFPWDFKKPQHLLLIFDGMLYLLLIFYLLHSRSLILIDVRKIWLLIVIGSIVMALAFGTGSFISAVRHRAKVVAPLIVIAAVRLPVFSLRGRGSFARGESAKGNHEFVGDEA